MHFDNYSIRLIELHDAEGYFGYIQNNRERFTKYMPLTVKNTPDLPATIAFVKKRIAMAAKNEFLTYIICDDSKSKIIGTLNVKSIDKNISKCELGFFIDAEYENKGIITRASKILISHCFQTMKMNKVFMRIAEENTASRRVAEKLNANLEGKLREDHRTHEDRFIDVLYYGLLKKDFLKS